MTADQLHFIERALRSNLRARANAEAARWAATEPATTDPTPRDPATPDAPTTEEP